MQQSAASAAEVGVQSAAAAAKVHCEAVAPAPAAVAAVACQRVHFEIAAAVACERVHWDLAAAAAALGDILDSKPPAAAAAAVASTVAAVVAAAVAAMVAAAVAAAAAVVGFDMHDLLVAVGTEAMVGCSHACETGHQLEGMAVEQLSSCHWCGTWADCSQKQQSPAPAATQHAASLQKLQYNARLLSTHRQLEKQPQQT